MKTLALMLLLVVPAVACKQGETLYEGACAANLAPTETVRMPDEKPSDEKPPTDKMPSWQREGIHADMPNSTAGADDISDRQKADAIIEGKKKAGVK